MRRPRLKLMVRVMITRNPRPWKPYTLNIWANGHFFTQDFWRRTDCEVVRHVIRKFVEARCAAYGYDMADIWEHEEPVMIEIECD